jgi:hypothetical protein
MLWVIRIIGLGILVGILSMIISAVFFRNGSEKDVTLVYMAIMDFIFVALIINWIRRRLMRS